MMSPVICRFDDCSESIVQRVVLATVDQMCGEADVSVDFLTAIEYPLEESISAVAPFGITEIRVSLDERRLVVSITATDPMPSAGPPLGDSNDVITSFFEIHTSEQTNVVKLSGPLE